MENKKEMRQWLEAFGLPHPLVIAGPCSAETEEQVLKIANELKDTDVTVFRAGIWKPRNQSFPYNQPKIKPLAVHPQPSFGPLFLL